MRQKLFPLLALLIFSATPACAQNAVTAEALLARMSLEDKVGQLVMTGLDQVPGSDVLERGAAGSLIGFTDAAAIAQAQDKARASRLGIPLLVGLDVLHGFRTLFPVPIAEAASFDTDMAARNAELAAREAAASGLNLTFAPMVDMSRDARWGRMVEGAGEDVALASAFAAARAGGFRKGGLAPVLKHFAGYGAVAGGRDYDEVSVSDFELQNLHFPPFRAALGPNTAVMTALTPLNGIPSSANPRLVRDTLRGAWKFDGVVMSDWGAIEGLLPQGFAVDGPDAVRKAMAAGIDIDIVSGLYARHLAGEVKAGRIPMAQLDAAVRRVLDLKIALGLFDAPRPDPARAEAAALTPELRTAARASVRASSVLLQNDGDLLPIPPGIGNIAVVGPFADNAFDQLGPHEARGRPEEAVTILSGIADRAAKNGARVRYAQGCDAFCRDANIGEAVEAARASDLVIAVLGEGREHSGEGASRAFLDFGGRQEDLLEALAATGKPIVLVIVAGRPLDLRRAREIAPAILMAWYPGTEGGGVADLLFGDDSPSAKLPVSWPRSLGQVPISYDRPPSSRPHAGNVRYTQRFLDEDVTPLFPFGHGLTYTRFAYSGLRAPEHMEGDSAAISVDVTNTGAREGVEIAQLYVRDEAASRVLPLRRLKAWQRVALKAGETKTVTFTLKREDLGFFDESGARVIEPGTFRIGAGGDSTAALTHVLTLPK